MQTGNKVALADGRLVDSASLEWRLECAHREGLAIEIARLPTFEDRSARVNAYRRVHGDKAAEQLTERLKQLRQARIEQARAA